MEITKMHGLGNSQILVEDLEGSLEGRVGLNYKEISRAICNPNFGVGSDQMLVIGKSTEADFQMRVFNQDGGEAEMCGNGIRCVAKYLYDEGMADHAIKIETLAGTKEVRVQAKEYPTNVEVEMGVGKILEESKEVLGFEGSFVSVGNPHFVIFTEEASRSLAQEKGLELEEANEFQPDKANIEFAKKTGRNELETYVWERGAGVTLACGTGACATALAAKNSGISGKDVTVKLLGGKLQVELDDDNSIRMSGPAEYIISGVIPDVREIYSNIKK